jgi:hypothetical protein
MPPVIIVKPGTCSADIVELLRLLTCKRGPPKVRPRIEVEACELICQMSRENALWDAPRIQGELRMLRIEVR